MLPDFRQRSSRPFSSYAGAPPVSHEQRPRIPDTTIADVHCRSRDQFHDVTLTLVAEGADQILDSWLPSRRNDDFIGTNHGSRESVDQEVPPLARLHATEQVGEQ